MKRLAIVGAGGFARELEWLVSDLDSEQQSYDVVGFLVSDLSRLTEHDSRSRVLGDLDWLSEHFREIDALALGIGEPEARLRMAREISARWPGIEWPALIHPNAHFDRNSCEIGRGTVICAGVIATVGVRFEEFCMVNLSCTVGHEARIGAGAVLNPTVNISGGVDVGEEVLIGTGAQVLQYRKLGKGAVIGAGAVVVKDVGAGETVAGVPAKPLGVGRG